MSQGTSSRPTELGYVIGRNGTRYAIMDDMTWRVRRSGVNLPVTEKAIEAVYEGFNDFPAYPGSMRLRDWAEHVKGKVVWHHVHALPPDTIV